MNVLNHKKHFRVYLTWIVLILAIASSTAQETIDVGRTGFDVKRPVLAAACPNGCPWGELGDFVKEAMAPLGYEVILCRNCNRNLGPSIVSTAAYPPQLQQGDLESGTTSRVNAPIDFGITASDMLTRAYFSDDGGKGQFTNLRLIAKINDPFYLLVAVKKASSIKSLDQIKKEHMAVKIVGGGVFMQSILDYYGITRKDIELWGGSFGNVSQNGEDSGFDVIISDLGTPANNPESAYWTEYSIKNDLCFIELPDELLNKLCRQLPGTEKVLVRWGLLKGVDHAFYTAGRNGESVFARDDIPEQAAYDVARAIDEYRAALKWFIRPYSYDPGNVWKNAGVPLHPGAERYYREMGYIKQ
jgi:uncharacterized protein